MSPSLQDGREESTMCCVCVLNLQNILKVELPLVTGGQGRLQQAQQRRQRGGEKQTQNQIQNRSSARQSQTRASSASPQERSSAQTGDSKAQSGGGRVPVVLERILDEPEAPKVPLPEGQGGQSPNPRIHNH